MKIWKLHALGNHFVFATYGAEIDFPELARLLSRKALSVGADGILALDTSSKFPRVRMWNPDGSEDFCGNGLCCAGHLLHYLGFSELTMLDTPYALVPVCVEPIDEARSRVTIEIARGTFDPDQIPLAVQHSTRLENGFEVTVAGRSFELLPLNNGNMHSVIFVDDLPDDQFFFRFGPLLENHPLFPARTNVLWCAVSGGEIHLRIWERAVGETLACGTGSAAAVVACHHAGVPLPPKVAVIMRGGSAIVSLKPHSVQLTTCAELVFEGRLVQDISSARLM